MKTRAVLALALAALAFAACGGGSQAPAAAEPPTAKLVIRGDVVYVDGEVTLYRDGAESKLGLAEQVMQGDSIVVGDNSSCELAMSGVGTIRLRSGSTATINGLEGAKRIVEVTMARGSALFSVQKLEEREGFMVRTQSAAFGVRGTRFLVTTYDDGSAAVAVADGAVAAYPRILLDSKVYDPASGIAPAIDMDAFPVIGAGMECVFGPAAFKPVEAPIKAVADAEGPEAERAAAGRFSDAAKELRFDLAPLGPESRRPLEDMSGVTSNPVPLAEDIPYSTYKEGVAAAKAENAAKAGTAAAPKETAPKETTGMSAAPKETTGMSAAPKATAPDPATLLPKSAFFRVTPSPAGTGPSGGGKVGLFSSSRAGAVEKPYAEGDVSLAVASGAATGKAEGGEYAVDVTSEGVRMQDIQATPAQRFALKPGRVYLLGFTVRGDAGKPFEVTAGSAAGAAYAPIARHEATADRVRYVQPFYFAGPADGAARIAVGLGSGKGKVWISDLSISDSGAALAAPDPARNLIVNGDFGGGLVGWSTYAAPGAKALFFAEGGVFTCVPATPGKESFSVQLALALKVPLDAGRKYRIEFDAWSSRIEEFSLYVGEGGVDVNGDGNLWTPYVRSVAVPLTQVKAHYSAEFAMPAYSDPSATVTFDMGTIRSPVSIDNVRLVAVE